MRAYDLVRVLAMIGSPTRPYLAVHTVGFRCCDAGDIGSTISTPSFMDHEDLWFGRLVFDLSFFAIVVIVLLQGVVFGIIIDTFGTLRDEEKDKRNDMTSKCFICGISRDEFDRHGEGFLNHIKNDHNVSGCGCVVDDL
jgi:hypothetical protein